MRACRRFVLVLVLLLLATPAWAYVIYLKDGSQIQARDKYRVVGDKAYFTLPSGTETFIPLAEIDVTKTEEVNRVKLGAARILEGVGEAEERSRRTEPIREDTLEDLIAGRSTGLSLPEVRRRDEASAPRPDELPLTRAGYVDLMALPRLPYTDPEITSEVLQYLKGQGVEEVKIYRGTAPESPLIEVVANSEASVFKALKDCANALVQLNGRYPDRVGALELLLVTGAQVRAGQFVLTPPLANQLVTGKIDGPAFFYRHVQF